MSFQFGAAGQDMAYPSGYEWLGSIGILPKLAIEIAGVYFAARSLGVM
jgi:hypothetical protein